MSLSKFTISLKMFCLYIIGIALVVNPFETFSGKNL